MAERRMKDSGIEWIGRIPNEWKCERGKFILKYCQKPVREDDDIITCFRDGEVTLRSNRREDGFTMSDKEIGYQGIDVGDLVVHGMDGFAGAIGISDSRGKASPVLNVLNSDENVKYIMYYLRCMANNDVFTALATGIRVRSCDLRWNKLSELRYPVPPIEEQKKIADFLDSKCSEIDALSKDIEKEIETLEEYKKSVITEAVTKGIDKNVEFTQCTIDYVSDYPNTWELKRLKYALQERNSRTNTGSEELLSISQYKGVIPSSENANRTMQANSLVGYKKVYIDDLVFNKLNPVLARFGRSGYDGITSPDYAVYIVDHSVFYTKFLEYILKTDRYAKEYGRITLGVGDGYTRLYTNQLGCFYVATPKLEEQKRILEYLEGVIADIDEIITNKKKQLEALNEYKKSLIYEYVTGKKEVC